MTQSTTLTTVAPRRLKRSLPPTSTDWAFSAHQPTQKTAEQHEPSWRRHRQKYTGSQSLFALALLSLVLSLLSIPSPVLAVGAQVQHDEDTDYGIVVQKFEEEFLVDFSQPSWRIRQDVVKALDELKWAYNQLVSNNDPYKRRMIDVQAIGIVDRFGNFVPLDLFQKRRMLRDVDDNDGRSLRGSNLERFTLRLVTSAACLGCLESYGPIVDERHYYRRMLQPGILNGIPTTGQLLNKHDRRIKQTPNKFPSVDSAIDLKTLALQRTAAAEEAAANYEVKADHAKTLRNYAIREERRVEAELEEPKKELARLRKRLNYLRDEHASGRATAQVVDQIRDVNKEIRDIEDRLDVAQSRLNQLKVQANKAERKAEQAERRANRLLRLAKQALDAAEEAEAIAEANATKIASRIAAAEAQVLNRRQGNDANRRR